MLLCDLRHLVVVGADEIDQLLACQILIDVWPGNREKYLPVIVVAVHHFEAELEVAQSPIAEQERARPRAAAGGRFEMRFVRRRTDVCPDVDLHGVDRSIGVDVPATRPGTPSAGSHVPQGLRTAHGFDHVPDVGGGLLATPSNVLVGADEGQWSLVEFPRARRRA